jgi:hypothetical protein
MQAMYCDVTMRRVRAAVAVSITCSECVVLALGIQQAMHMRHVVICGLPGYTAVSILSQKRYNFQKQKVIEQKKCVLIFRITLAETFLILRRIKRDMIKNIQRFSCKLPVIFVRF